MRSRPIAVIVLLVATSGLGRATAQDPAQIGRWSAPFWEGGAMAYDPPSADTSRMFPAAVSIVALPDGRILYWNGLEGSEDGDLWAGSDDGTSTLTNSRSRVMSLDGPSWSVPSPERGSTDDERDLPPYATKNMFCADQKLLYDGTALVAGGTENRVSLTQDPIGGDIYGDDEARVFDPETDEFRPVGQMREPRWYPSMVTLADGRVLIAGGLRRLIGSFSYPEPAFSQVRLSEIYDPVAHTWSDAGLDQWSLPTYARIHLLPDGTLFFGGAGQTWAQFGETADMAMWGLQRIYDPATQTWATAGPTRYGIRSGATSTMLRLEPPYERAQILLSGGTLGPSPSSWIATTISEVITVTADGIVNEATMKGPLDGLNGDLTQLRNPRWFGSSVMLPTGEVLMLNGGDVDDVVDPGLAAGVRTPELYDPSTGQWRELAPAARDRIYHNTAVLLADGRVLVGGNAPHTAHYYKHDNTLSRSNNFRDSTFEIYEPPYLFRGARPTVSAVTPVDDGAAIALEVGDDTAAGDISEVVLVRMGAATHTVDGDMRAVVLEHAVDDGDAIAQLPAPTILPPGPYHVFAMRQTPEGPVPSVARPILIQPSDGGIIAAPAV